MSESFIFQAYLEDVSICDELIAYNEQSLFREPGMVNDPHGVKHVDKTVKDSTDVPLHGDLLEKYALKLRPVLDMYIARYPACDMYAAWSMMEFPNVQKYDPSGGFFQWHTERNSSDTREIASRHLAFMTYLNDVTDGGETEFMIQNLKVAPRKGLTLIWPADWTHTHRGIASPTQEKYIVTGWFNYV